MLRFLGLIGVCQAAFMCLYTDFCSTYGRPTFYGYVPPFLPLTGSCVDLPVPCVYWSYQGAYYHVTCDSQSSTSFWNISYAYDCFSSGYLQTSGSGLSCTYWSTANTYIMVDCSNNTSPTNAPTSPAPTQAPSTRPTKMPTDTPEPTSPTNVPCPSYAGVWAACGDADFNTGCTSQCGSVANALKTEFTASSLSNGFAKQCFDDYQHQRPKFSPVVVAALQNRLTAGDSICNVAIGDAPVVSASALCLGLGLLL